MNIAVSVSGADGERDGPGGGSIEPLVDERLGRRRARHAEQRGRVLDGDRSGEQEALAELAAELTEPLELRWLLDPLGHDPQPEGLAQGDDRVGEGPRARGRPRRRPTKSRAIFRMSTGNRRR